MGARRIFSRGIFCLTAFHTLSLLYFPLLHFPLPHFQRPRQIKGLGTKVPGAGLAAFAPRSRRQVEQIMHK